MEDDGAINLNDICAVAGLGRGRDGSYEYYMSEPIISNEPKGTGPFIMAGIQIKEMMEKFPQQ
jgi:rhamnogalacturonyl hydrolase YesR